MREWKTQFNVLSNTVRVDDCRSTENENIRAIGSVPNDKIDREPSERERIDRMKNKLNVKISNRAHAQSSTCKIKKKSKENE